MTRPTTLAIGLLSLALGLGHAAHAAPVASPAHAAPADPTGHADAAAPGTAHAPVGPADKPNILEPQPSLAIWTVVVFLGLLAVLGKFAWKPLMEALRTREEHLEHVLFETEKARNDGERLLAEHRKQMAAANDTVQAMLAEARRDAEARGAEIVRKAQAEAEAAGERARGEIGRARDQALGEIWTKTADLAVAVAGKVIQKNLSGDDQRRMVEAALAELPAGGPSNGQGGRTS